MFFHGHSRRNSSRWWCAYPHRVLPPHTAADMAHSTHSTQPALRPHRTTPRAEDKPPQTHRPHSNGLCAPLSEGPDPGSAQRHVNAGSPVQTALIKNKFGLTPPICGLCVPKTMSSRPTQFASKTGVRTTAMFLWYIVRASFIITETRPPPVSRGSSPWKVLEICVFLYINLLKVPCAPKWNGFEFPIIKTTKLLVETRAGTWAKRI